MDGSRWHTARTPCSNRAKNSGGRSRSHIGSRLAPRLLPSASRNWSGRVSKPEVDKPIVGSLPLAERHSPAHPARPPEIESCAEAGVILNGFDNPNCRRPWEASSVLDSLRRRTARKSPESTPPVALDSRKMDVPLFISGTPEVSAVEGRWVALRFEKSARGLGCGNHSANSARTRSGPCRAFNNSTGQYRDTARFWFVSPE